MALVYFSSLLSEILDARTFAAFRSKFDEANVDYGYLGNTNDIWLRDFMPIQVGENEFVQFSLTRDYYYQKDNHKRTNPAPICRALGIEPIIPIYEGQPIYLDGGNVIHGFDKVIITEKVFAENDIPREDLSMILQEVLKVQQIIFIPVEPGDDTGHADGMVRFVDERTVVANDYSKADVDKDFKDRFYGALAGSGLDVKLVPYHPVSEKVNGYWSAAGCYINFLQVGDKIFLPTFDDPLHDEAATRRFEEIFGASNIITIPSRGIAEMGGVLNCLSWEIYY